MPPHLRPPLRSISIHLHLRPPIRPLSLPFRPPNPKPPNSKTPIPKPRPPPNTPTPRQRPRTEARTALGVLFFFASWFPAWSFFHENVFCIMNVDGISMSPFLNTDHERSLVRDRVWVNKWRAGEGLERGMLVAYRSPIKPERMAVKRVIALEGDTVVTKPPFPFLREDVPFGHVWVEGDQVEGHKNGDSNWVGPVSKSLIVGTVGGVVWPWGKAGRIRWEDWKGSDRVLVGNGKVEEIVFF